MSAVPPKKQKAQRQRTPAQQIATLNSGKRIAWARCFEAERCEHEALKLLAELKNDARAGPHIPVHVADKYRELVTRYDDNARECPICLEHMTFDTSFLTDCGHLFHAKCIEGLPVCPVCRGKYAKKKAE